MDNKLQTISNLFEGNEIRSIWDSEKEDYYFSVIDVVSALTESNDPSHYWRTLKYRMIQEGNETVTNCDTFKLKAKDGKMRNTDMLGTKNILRLIESIPSPKAEPFKMWLASLGSEMLTNEIYKGWSGMKASEYKAYKGLRKESLRDNMTDIEVALTNIGEIAARDIALTEHPEGLKENLKVAARGGSVAKGARDLYEKETKKSAISNKNVLNYQYIDEVKQFEIKVDEEELSTL